MLFKNRKFYVLNFAFILALLGGIFGAIPVKPVHAAALIVTNTNDSGAGSLCHAIFNAAPGDTITLDPSLVGGATQLSSPLVIMWDLTIDGSGLYPLIKFAAIFHDQAWSCSNRKGMDYVRQS